MLGMGFTGKEATKFKEAYIDAFEDMEDYIRETLKNQSISLIQENSFFPSAEIEKFLNRLTSLETETKKNKQFSEGLHQRLMFMEDTLDKRPTSGLSVSDIPKTDFFVYFAFNPNNGLTKIGRSKMPESRVWVFQAVEPDLTLILLVNTASLGSSVALEQLFHKLFEKKKHNRELFLLNEYNMNVATMIKNAIELEN